MFAKTPIEPNAIYTRQETAHVLGVSLSTLKHLTRTGQFKVSQPTGLRRVFIRGTSILEMLEVSERGIDRGLDRQGAEVRVGHAFDSANQALRSKQIPMRAGSAAAKRNARPAGGANR